VPCSLDIGRTPIHKKKPVPPKNKSLNKPLGFRVWRWLGVIHASSGVRYAAQLAFQFSLFIFVLMIARHEDIGSTNVSTRFLQHGVYAKMTPPTLNMTQTGNSANNSLALRNLNAGYISTRFLVESSLEVHFVEGVGCGVWGACLQPHQGWPPSGETEGVLKPKGFLDSRNLSYSRNRRGFLNNPEVDTP